MCRIPRSCLVLAFCLVGLVGGRTEAQEMTVERCEALIADVKARCEAANDPRLDCELEVARIRERCMNQVPPPPPPPPTCEDECQVTGNKAYRECRGARGTERECEAVRRRVVAECAERCDDEPEPPTCAEACGRKARVVFAECVEAGGDRGRCDQIASAALRACIGDCRDDDDPEPPTCEDRCARAAREHVEVCKERVAAAGDATDVTEEDCIERGQALHERCSANCEPPTCRDRCTAHAREELAMCIESGELSEEECRAHAARTQNTCFREKCDRPDDDPTCVEACAVRARAFAQECKDEGGDEDVCNAKAHAGFARCRHECRPEPPACATACREEAAELLARCNMADDADAAECRRRVGLHARRCLWDCKEDEPQPPCEVACRQKARRLFVNCVAESDNPEACRERVLNWVEEECFSECDDPTRPCADRCENAGQEALEECLSDPSDPDPARCAIFARHVVARCKLRCEVPDEPNCLDRCANFGRGVRDSCVEEGFDEDRCNALGRSAAERCVEACVIPNRPKIDCEEPCARQARELYGLCRDNGGSEEFCTTASQRFNRRCEAKCADTPKPSCRERAKRIGRRAFSACIDQGGEPAVCRVRALLVAKSAFRRCVHHNNCRQRCAHAARKLYSTCRDRLEDDVIACVEEGGTREDCIAEARRRCRAGVQNFLTECGERCAGGGDDDEEPPACEDRCANAAADIKEECIAMGGDEAECAAEAAAWETDECLPRCEDPGPPDRCDFDCAARGEELRERCSGDDIDDPEACLARIDDFVAQCEDAQARHCAETDIAMNSTPRDFSRGDANADLSIDIADPIAMLSDLFLNTRIIKCPDAADANDDGVRDISDAILTLLKLFGSRNVDIPPPNDPGVDFTDDGLFCEDA